VRSHDLGKRLTEEGAIRRLRGQRLEGTSRHAREERLRLGILSAVRQQPRVKLLSLRPTAYPSLRARSRTCRCVYRLSMRTS